MISKDGYQGCVIYGRGRMGKTELARKCVLEQKSPAISQAKGKNGLFDVVEKIEGDHVF